MSSVSHADNLWEEILTKESLKTILDFKLKRSKVKGIDRLNIDQFFHQREQHINTIQKKCLDGSYRFSPYLENLKPKGKNKYPRVIGIPTVRDRIVLLALKELLSCIFSNCVRRKLSKTYIHDITKLIPDLEIESTWIFRTDIKDFYPSIKRDILLNKISKKIQSDNILALLKRAIETPIVPNNYRKKDKNVYYNPKGIPQGLSISNILASIYIHDIDPIFIERKQDNIHYFRYVDDILLISPKSESLKVKNRLISECKQMQLPLNEDPNKTFDRSATEKFDYLGYSFNLPHVTIKQASVDRFIDSIASKFSLYKHSKHKLLEKHKDLTEEKIKNIFIFDLNKKITGSISKNQRYGWVLYYSAVNDPSIFYKLDKIIEKFFQRLEDFDRKAPKDLKKLSKTYHEDKYNLWGGYIHNYNQYRTYEEKREFLNKVGKIDPDKDYTKEEINEMYERYKNIDLASLEKDHGNIS